MSNELTLKMKQVLSPSQFIRLAKLQPGTILYYSERKQGYQLHNKDLDVTLGVASLLALTTTFDQNTKQFYIVEPLDRWGLIGICAKLNSSLSDELGGNIEVLAR